MGHSMPGFPLHHQLPELTQTHVCWVSAAIQPSHLLSSPAALPSIFPIIRVFSNESALHIRWPKYWSFIFSISASNEYLGLISFMKSYFRYCYYIYAYISPISQTPNCVFEEIIGSLLKFTHFTGSVVGSQPYPWCVPFLHPWLLINLKCPMYSTSCIHEDSLLYKPMLLAPILILSHEFHWTVNGSSCLLSYGSLRPRLFVFRTEFLLKWKDSLRMVLPCLKSGILQCSAEMSTLP